jgi:uncharacterized protein YdeI (YjbR/CyaY-like superfamily)
MLLYLNAVNLRVGQQDKAKKAKPAKVAEELKHLVSENNGLFQPQDALTAKQITSYLSRLRREAEKNAKLSE